MSKILMGVGAALLLSLATVVPAEAKDGGHSSGSRRTSRSYDNRSYGNYRGDHRYDYRGDHRYDSRDFRGDRDYRGGRRYDYRGDRGDRDYFYRYRNFYDFPFSGHR